MSRLQRAIEAVEEEFSTVDSDQWRDALAELKAAAEVQHGLVGTERSVQELMTGTGSGTTAECICGEWRVSRLPNRAGHHDTLDQFVKHLAAAGAIERTVVK